MINKYFRKYIIRDATDALNWLTNSSTNPFTFRWICEILDMDYNFAIFNILQRLLQEDGKVRRRYKEILKHTFKIEIVLMLAILEQAYLDVMRLYTMDRINPYQIIIVRYFILEYLEKNNKEYLLNG